MCTGCKGYCAALARLCTTKAPTVAELKRGLSQVRFGQVGVGYYDFSFSILMSGDDLFRSEVKEKIASEENSLQCFPNLFP